MTPRLNRLAILVSLVLSITHSNLTVGADDSDRELRWWKGNIHTHSLWSDGNDFPEMIADWYRSHGYNFLALSDHNVLSEGVRWMKNSEIIDRGGEQALAKYQRRFPSGWVETRGDAASPDFAVRLKPLSEFRALLETADQFVMIPGEEISDRAEGVPVHLNATNIRQVIQPLGGATVREAITNNLRAVEEQAEREGRELLLHLNHPNFGFAVTAEDLAAVVAERFFEVYNGHLAVGHLGDADHPGVERLWDVANTIRLAKLNAAPLFGVATDDSHKYHGRPGSHPGRGWIMVQARYLTPEHLIRAMKAGNFYASSGVTLASVKFDEGSRELTLEIESQPNVSYKTEFIGTRKDGDLTSQPRTDGTGQPIRSTRKYDAGVGEILATVEGSSATYRLSGEELYVRAVVTSSAPPVDPAFRGQRQQAWTQPVGWLTPLHDGEHAVVR